MECGACDGEFQSNTLYLELKRNWTGLLIEPNRKNYQQLLKTNRRAFYINACLSPYNHPAVVNMIKNSRVVLMCCNRNQILSNLFMLIIININFELTLASFFGKKLKSMKIAPAYFANTCTGTSFFVFL